MTFKSTWLPPEPVGPKMDEVFDETKRRPFTSVRVRCEPRPRKSTKLWPAPKPDWLGCGSAVCAPAGAAATAAAKAETERKSELRTSAATMRLRGRRQEHHGNPATLPLCPPDLLVMLAKCLELLPACNESYSLCN